jgi:hypothetical protein
VTVTVTSPSPWLAWALVLLLPADTGVVLTESMGEQRAGTVTVTSPESTVGTGVSTPLMVWVTKPIWALPPEGAMVRVWPPV